MALKPTDGVENHTAVLQAQVEVCVVMAEVTADVVAR